MKKIYQLIVLLILLSFVTVGVFMTLAPDLIPVHYDLQGNIDRWGSKYEFLILPVLTALFGGVMTLIGRSEGRKGQEMNEKVIAILSIWVLILFNIIWSFFMWKGFQGDDLIDISWDLATKVFFVILIGLFIPLGNMMPKVRRNGVLGLRTKWSMANDACWQRSQRFGGFLMVFTGFVGVAAVSIAPVSWGGYIMLGLILVMTLGGVTGTYLIYRKEHK